jgi:hypothetical protein
MEDGAMIRNTKLKQDVLRGIWKLYAMAFTNISDDSLFDGDRSDWRRGFTMIDYPMVRDGVIFMMNDLTTEDDHEDGRDTIRIILAAADYSWRMSSAITYEECPCKDDWNCVGDLILLEQEGFMFDIDQKQGKKLLTWLTARLMEV